MIHITDYEVKNDIISIENLDAATAEVDVNDFFTFIAKQHPSQGWMVCGDRIVIPNPVHPTCEVYNAEQFHKRFKGDYFNDLLLEYANNSDLKWEEPWFPPQVDDAQEEAYRDFRRQCGV